MIFNSKKIRSFRQRMLILQNLRTFGIFKNQSIHRGIKLFCVVYVGGGPGRTIFQYNQRHAEKSTCHYTIYLLI